MIRDFEADRHVRLAAVPAPGDQRQVLDLIALLEPAPFDPDRSPWDVTLIEGLAGGRAGLYLRAHHALTDGMGGLSLIDSLLDPPRPTATRSVRRAPSQDARRRRHRAH